MTVQNRSITKFGRFDRELGDGDHAIERMMAAKRCEWTSSASRRGPLIPDSLCKSEGTEHDATIRRHIRGAVRGDRRQPRSYAGDARDRAGVRQALQSWFDDGQKHTPKQSTSGANVHTLLGRRINVYRP